MSECAYFESTIQGYVAGDRNESELGPLLVHCRGCKDCRQALELHRDLLDLAATAPRPEEEDFDLLRRRVLNALPRPSRSRAIVRVVLAAAACVLLFVAGLSTGRAVPERVGALPVTDSNGSVMNRLVAAINADAASNRELADVEDSRFTYSNVSFRRVDGDRVALDFDVSTHVELVEPVRSELVGEVLVHSLLNPSTTGARLKALSYAEPVMEPKVRDALVFAMLRDDNLAVRMKSLTILSDQLHEPQVESAVLQTLRDDESVQMRLLALDYLATHAVDRDRIRDAIEQSPQTGEGALEVRLSEYDPRL
jgi:hypothetical protein